LFLNWKTSGQACTGLEDRKLSLHVPEPEYRPGDQPDFSRVAIPQAGEVRRPEIDESPENMRDLAFGIIRVLDPDGKAVGPWASALTAEELGGGLRHMMTLRANDARMLMAQRQGKTSFYMQHLGEEAIRFRGSRHMDTRRLTMDGYDKCADAVDPERVNLFECWRDQTTLDAWRR
jgi:hypothetical protein